MTAAARHQAKAQGGDAPTHRYPSALKTEAVRRVREARESVALVSRELGIKPGSLYLWLRKADVLESVHP